MGVRGLTLLQLVQKPADERAAGWDALVRERTEAATNALLRDFQRRGFITTGTLDTLQLTAAGKIRMDAGQAHEDARIREDL
jgi:hypothetical protein